MIRRCLAILVATVVALAVLPTTASANSPWWNLITSARPTNLWTPKSEVQELKLSNVLTTVSVEGNKVACMGGPVFGAFCPELDELPNDEGAAELQASLEVPYGAGGVEVTEVPGAPGRFLIKAVGGSIGRYVAPIEASSLGEDPASTKVLSEGGSGRLVLTATNVGDASIEGSEDVVTITDAMPIGLSAYHAEAYAGYANMDGPVSCDVEDRGMVRCSFSGTVQPFEAIEIEVYVSVTPILSGAGESGRVSVSGGGARPISSPQTVAINAADTPFGIESYSLLAEEEGGGAVAQAGSHPFQLTTTIQLNQGPLSPGPRSEAVDEQPAQPRNFRFKLPVGLVGNATTVPTCSFDVFTTRTEFINECPPESAIGVASVSIIEPASLHFARVAVPIFNIAPALGEPARFGFMVAGVPITLDTSVRSGEAYGITVNVRNASQIPQLLATTATFWGSPGDPRHDGSRGWACAYFSHPGVCSRPAGEHERAFLRLPTSCGGDLSFPMELEPWNTPLGSDIVDMPFSSGPLDGCSRVPFEPSIAVESDTHSAESPSGPTVHIRIPQEVSEAPGGIAESDVRNTEVTLPPGLKINPAAAKGLQACSEGQAGFRGMKGEEAVFDEEPASCPEASKLGSVKIHSPLLEEELTGWVYQATQGANPFGSLLALYVVAEAPGAGVRVKLAGKVEPKTDGRLVSTFDMTPQLPFEEIQLSFFGGPGASLATSGCGAYVTESSIEPWSGGSAATPSSEFQVSGGPNGTNCQSPPPFAPSFNAGAESPLAGSYSPFILKLSREDGTQQIKSIDTVLPPGVIGKLVGIPYCPESAISQAQARTSAGEGEVEQNNPSCAASSQVGTVRVGAGIGPNLLFVQGKVYLAGPYDGAPISLLIVTPSVAGPFDLGNVAVRAALYVNPETTQITAKSDPLPDMLHGIPLDVRSIALKMDRSEFTLNPTNCERMSIVGTATSLLGQAANLSNPFQVGGCRGLAFKPRLALSLKGPTKRTGHPALKAVLTYPKGASANIARAQVGLPHGEFLDQGNLNKVCTQPELKSQACPKKAIYGKAKAWSPLLEKPLEGPVYLAVGFGYKLPALVAELNGQIRVLLKGKIDTDSANGIRNTFEAVPDAPVSKFVLELKGGKKYGLLENSENICRETQRATARFTGQNGKVHSFSPEIANSCPKGKSAQNRKRRGDR